VTIFSCITSNLYLSSRDGRKSISRSSIKRAGHFGTSSRSINISPGSSTSHYQLNSTRTNHQFSPTLINRLSNPSSKSSDDSKPQSNDEIIRKRLAAESEHLRTQEAEILRDISSALEKENLDKEKPGMSSEVLGRDIEEIREKIERMKKDRMGQVGKGVQSAQEGVRKCYT
jgi:hypothetical protein